MVINLVSEEELEEGQVTEEDMILQGMYQKGSGSWRMETNKENGVGQRGSSRGYYNRGSQILLTW